MKKIFKILSILILLVIVIVGGFASFIAIRGIPSYDVNVPNIPKVEVTPERIERGAKIASMLCRNCHFNPETGKLTGRELKEAPAFGAIYSKNITQDAEAGIGKWTDAELIYFIRTGINPHTSKYVPPYMVKLIHISDEDMRSIIAYLHSDKPELQPDKTTHPPTDPSFLTKFLCTVAFKPVPFPEKEIPNPDTSNVLEWGKYLTLYQLECYGCHSADFKTDDFITPEKSEGFLGGGNVLTTEEGATIKTLNLTPDEETGIGNWTEEQFSNAVRTGIVPNGPALRKPMVPFVQLTDGEVHAIYSYLRTVPKISNKIDRGI
ncbi:MAG: c-type cytochrome [Bacteroidia bacterium]|nr:c-type cytochrome [Bacteroidia bacterium]